MTLNNYRKKTESSLKPIIEEEAISFAVTHLEPKIIDEINILNASIKAMQECILKLNPTPLYIIVDGNRFKPKRLKSTEKFYIKKCKYSTIDY